MPEPSPIVDPVDGTRWEVDLDFLGSNWTCLWGAGCPGILDEPTPELAQGCCSVGAEMLDVDEAMNVAALAATLDPERFQFHAAATAGGVFSDGSRTNTRVVEGACVFLNRPGFAGGAGCALHLAAVAEGDAPMDWKPEVCWQLPLRIERSIADDGTATATLRRWRRADWGSDGETMAWVCTEHHAAVNDTGHDPLRPTAYVGTDRVVDSLADEIEALVGPDVAVEIRRRLD